MKELKQQQELVKTVHTLDTRYEDIGLLIEMGYEDEDVSVIEEIETELNEFETA